MLNLIVPCRAPKCVWMSAGLLTYKLCNRNLDCEHCPLDAALRGDPITPELSSDSQPVGNRRSVRFPTDRIYSGHHTWLLALEHSKTRIRFGLDGFAASFLPHPTRVVAVAPTDPVRAGTRLCRIEFDEGALTLSTPISGQIAEWNPTLANDPAAVVTAPYDGGWIVELDVSAPEELTRLLPAGEAEDQARCDARRFLRRLAVHLLVDDGHGPTPPEDGRLLSDFREVLGRPRFLATLCELVH